MAVHKFSENLRLIDLDVPIEGYRKFIGCWLYRQGDRAVVVDPGPRSTIPVLLQALTQEGIERLDYVLLTHIHADHAGGAGILIERYPNSIVICHPRGIRHMIDPEKLWLSTKEVLGEEVAKAYGDVAAVPANSIRFEEKISLGNLAISASESPGHAPHHLCFLVGDTLFAGEVAGVTYPFTEGDLYLRPATPPPYDYAVQRSSVASAARLNASRLCFAHYGCRTDVRETFAAALDQLDTWLGIVESRLQEADASFRENVFADILKLDRYMSRFNDLPPDVQAREKYFSFNSIAGVTDYLLKC
jgi:glyoxylase-like metal-dependent hydrolase (beta-lactamase superfamily II)